jgi:CBS domain containing-hemolysin-like protein
MIRFFLELQQAVDADALTTGEIVIRLGTVLLLVVANAFFVAAEFALVAARRSRIDEMASRGDGGARMVQRTL